MGPVDCCGAGRPGGTSRSIVQICSGKVESLIMQKRNLLIFLHLRISFRRSLFAACGLFGPACREGCTSGPTNGPRSYAGAFHLSRWLACEGGATGSTGNARAGADDCNAIHRSARQPARSAAQQHET